MELHTWDYIAALIYKEEGPSQVDHHIWWSLASKKWMHLGIKVKKVINTQTIFCHILKAENAALWPPVLASLANYI